MQLFKPDDYLTVKQSYFGILADPDAPNPLFHYDYERDKEAYTEAHVQVFGANEHLDPMIIELSPNRKKKHMGELHFPVGGRRFRPALEDVLEFLIDEGLVDPKEGWKDVLETCRAGFRTKQLRAAVRREPDAAVAVLRSMDYKIVEPSSALGKILNPRKPGKRRST